MTSIIWRKGAQTANWSSRWFHFSRLSWSKTNVRNHSLWNLWMSQSTFQHILFRLCLWACLFPGFLVFLVLSLGEQVGFLFNDDGVFVCEDVSFIFFIRSFFPSKRRSNLVVTTMNSGDLLLKFEFRLCHSRAAALGKTLHLTVPRCPHL